MTMLSRAALAAALSLLVSAPVVAADNYTIQSGGAARTIRAKDLGTSLAPMSIAIDGAGLERFTTANPGYVTFPNGTVLSADTVIRSTSTDRGGTITAGGTAQQMMAANTARRGFLIQNQSTGDLYINGLSTAAANQTSLRIPAGALYETSPHHSGTGAVSIFGATTGQAFYAREF